MNSFTYNVPTKVIFGKDALDNLHNELKAYSPSKILVLYGSGSVIKTGVLDKVTKVLDDNNYEYIKIGGVKPNPVLSFANEVRDEAVKAGVDFVLAVGGGSVIDTAKGVIIGLKAPEKDIWDFWTKKEEIKEVAPLGVILTISAAGSETSDSAVLTKEDEKMKKGLSTEFNRPKFCLLNPEFTFTLPKYQVACGVVDILMHTMDRYFADTKDNDVTDEMAEGIMRVVFKHGKTAVDNPYDYKSMSELMWAGSLSHNTITGLGANTDFVPHQLSHGVSAAYDSAHGATLACTWNGFANYVSEEKPERFVKYAKAVHGLEGEDSVIVKEAIDKTVAYFKSLGMPVTLPELLGKTLTEAEIDELTNLCSFDNTRTIGTLKVLNHDDMKAIYTWLNK